MIKFALTITFCSALYNQCLQPITISDIYDTHRDCAIAGYNKTLKVFKALPSEPVNRDLVYGKFSCHAFRTI